MMALWRRQEEIFRSGRGGGGDRRSNGGKKTRALSVPRKPAADRMGMQRTMSRGMGSARARAHKAAFYCFTNGALLLAVAPKGEVTPIFSGIGVYL